MRWLMLFVLAATPALAEALFEARQLTPRGEYTFGIEIRHKTVAKALPVELKRLSPKAS